jgi:predicted RNA methylase
VIEAFYVVLLSILTSLDILQPWQTLLLMIPAIPGVIAMSGAAPFVPTKKRILHAMIEFAEIKRGETVCDLGCGDGRLVFAAADKGAKAVGYELSVPTYAIAKLRWFFNRKGKILYSDFWKQDLSKMDVVLCFLTMETMVKFHDKIWPTLKPGCRVVSHAFRMKGIEAVKTGGGAVLYVKK